MKSITEVIPEQAFDKATEGGWSDNQRRYQVVQATTGSHMVPVEIVALDPTFWKALGKSLRWGFAPYKKGDEWLEEWQHRALQFYMLILHGNDTDDFWKQLLA